MADTLAVQEAVCIGIHGRPTRGYYRIEFADTVTKEISSFKCESAEALKRFKVGTTYRFTITEVPESK